MEIRQLLPPLRHLRIQPKISNYETLNPPTHCHPERSEAAAERSRRTPCLFATPAARQDISTTTAIILSLPTLLVAMMNARCDGRTPLSSQTSKLETLPHYRRNPPPPSSRQKSSASHLESPHTRPQQHSPASRACTYRE